MLKKLSAIVLIVGILLVIGCSAHIHQVGNGPQGNDIVEERQWYVLFGYVPSNEGTLFRVIIKLFAMETPSLTGGVVDKRIVI